jgi:hypothetical protein
MGKLDKCKWIQSEEQRDSKYEGKCKRKALLATLILNGITN